MKRAAPRTFKHAMQRITGTLTVEEAAMIAGKSTRLVHYWGDGDSDQEPTLSQALALDAAYVAASGDIAVIFQSYRVQLESRLSIHETADPIDRLADMVKEVGEAADAYRANHKHPSIAQKTEALKEVAEAITALELMARDLEQETPALAVAS